MMGRVEGGGGRTHKYTSGKWKQVRRNRLGKMRNELVFLKLRHYGTTRPDTQFTSITIRTHVILMSIKIPSSF